MGAAFFDSCVGAYCYGFNGKEKDDEGEWGSSTVYDYGFRVYDPGIAKFLSVDPLAPEYPWYTPYQFAGNKPIRFIDLDGLEEYDPMRGYLPSPAFTKNLLIETAVGIGDGLANIGLISSDIVLESAQRGITIRKMLVQDGHSVPESVSNSDLGEAFQLRRRATEAKVEPRKGVLGNFVDLGVAVLSVVAAAPAKAGGPVLAATVRPMASRGLADILGALSHRARIKQISGFADPAHLGKNIKQFEAESGALLEAGMPGLKLGPSNSLDGDYMITKGAGGYSSGKTIDQFGVPKKAIDSGGFQMSEFIESIDSHFRKTSDFLLMDIRHLSKKQQSSVGDYINTKYSDQAERLITIK